MTVLWRPPSLASQPDSTATKQNETNAPPSAEMRGPEVRRRYEDSGDDFDLDMDQRTRALGGRSGRIILLGDGHHDPSTDSDDHDMLGSEDQDLEAQAGPDLAGSFDDDDNDFAGARGAREGTPGPERVKNEAASGTTRSESSAVPTETKDTVMPDKLEAPEDPKAAIKAASDGLAPKDPKEPKDAEMKTEDKPASAD